MSVEIYITHYLKWTLYNVLPMKNSIKFAFTDELGKIENVYMLNFIYIFDLDILCLKKKNPRVS